MAVKTMRAYASIQPVKNVAGLGEYLKYGRGADRKNHLANDTNRYAAMYCDARSPEAFVGEAIRHARKNKRSNEAYSAIVAPPLGTYDGDKPQQMREMVSDVVEGQRRAHPNAKLLAVAHNDSKGQCGCGGKPHVHVVIMNHDVETGKAITANRTASSYRTIINELGAELGWHETEVTFKKDQAKVRETLVAQREIDQAQAKIVQAQTDIETAFHEADPQEDSPEIIATEREKLASERAKLEAARKKLANAGQFDQQLLDDVLAARDAAVGTTFTEWQQDFRKGLRERGIDLKVTEKGKATPHLKQRSKTQGVVYSRPGEAKGKKRAPGQKASALSPQVTVSGLNAAFQHHLDIVKQAEIDSEKTRLTAEQERIAQAAEAARIKAEQDRQDAIDADVAAQVQQPQTNAAADTPQETPAPRDEAEDRPRHEAQANPEETVQTTLTPEEIYTRNTQTIKEYTEQLEKAGDKEALDRFNAFAEQHMIPIGGGRTAFTIEGAQLAYDTIQARKQQAAEIEAAQQPQLSAWERIKLKEAERKANNPVKRATANKPRVTTDEHGRPT